MKNIALLLSLTAAANGAVFQLESRQAPASAGPSLGSGIASAMAGTLPKRKVLKIEEIKPKNPNAKRVKIIYGPYKLAATNSSARLGNGRSMDKGGTSYLNMVDDDFPKDVVVLEAWSEVRDENMKRAETSDGIYNHHNVFIDVSKTVPTAYGCESGRPSRNMRAAVFAGGATELAIQEYSTKKGDIKTGYYVSKDRRMLNMIDVVNYNKVERTVYTYTELEYLPGKPAGYIDTNLQLIDPGQCGGEHGALIHPPKGVQKFQVNSTGIVAALDGYILNLRGHLHDGGINIVLNINGKEVCNSIATYGGEGHVSKSPDGKVWETIRETSSCDEPVKVKKGDKIYMQANYDLGLHPSREMGSGHGGMGGMKVVANMRAAMDGGEGAEQMALVATYFAPT